MKKLSITIDLAKIDKSRINTRTYENSQGEIVTVKEYKMDIVPLKEKKVIKTGDTWRMVKTHFVCDTATKEEREAKTKTTFLGDAMQFEDIDPMQVETEEMKPEEIPF